MKFSVLEYLYVEYFIIRRWNHSLNSSALKSGDEGPQHTLEEFSGADLPLLVTETLTLDGREKRKFW